METSKGELTQKRLRLVHQGLDFLMQEHGQPQDVFSGDELLYGAEVTFEE